MYVLRKLCVEPTMTLKFDLDLDIEKHLKIFCMYNFNAKAQYPIM